MVEVSAIVNARPLIPVPTDPESPSILAPAMLLAQKIDLPTPVRDFNSKNLYKRQWKRVQCLASTFLGLLEACISCDTLGMSQMASRQTEYSRRRCRSVKRQAGATKWLAYRSHR